MSSNTTNSGIRTDEQGASYIPSSVRPDGTTRKEIRVRPGYRPPEDIEVYKNRTAEAFRNRGKGIVPGVEPPAPEPAAPKSKNAKRREAARQKAAEGTAPTKQEDSDKPNTDGQQPTPEAVDEEAEKEKKARNLKKKLRQAKELQEKKEKGESLLPEQFAKVLKIQELIRDLDKLGFDAEGEKVNAEG